MNNAIVFIMDRVGAGHLGPYGNTWIDTPHWNRLASQAILLENLITDSPSLLPVYDAYLGGSHAAMPVAGTSLLRRLQEADVASYLVTDEPLLAQAEWEPQFTSAHHLPPPDYAQPAERLEQTQLARFFAAAIDLLHLAAGDHPRGFLFWCHARAMAGAWDAPSEFRQRFADEDDPRPPLGADPPCFRTSPATSPDELFGWNCAYAAQVVALDTCLGAFLDAAEPWLDQDTLLILSSPRGYPLGEHHGIGDAADELYTELVHVPGIIRLPHRQQASTRLQTILQPRDMGATLREWFGLPVTPGSQPLLSPAVHPAPQAALTVQDQQHLVRTPAWLARFGHSWQLPPATPSTVELFLKPDDHWDVNDVADRCPHVVEALTEWVANIRQQQTFPEVPPGLAKADM